MSVGYEHERSRFEKIPKYQIPSCNLCKNIVQFQL